jgi:uridylate kinase
VTRSLSHAGPSPVVLSMGGSVLFGESTSEEFLKRIADLLREVGEAIPLAVTVGGGKTAREYIRLGRRAGLSEIELDELGIDVTRIHARLLASLVGPPAPSQPPTTLVAAVHELLRGSPVILGGTEPGHTTDGVAAMLAVRLRASRMVNATRVDGLYEQDPASHPDAKRIDRMDWAQFHGVVQRSARREAGQEFLFDSLGADSLARARIPLAIVNGRDLENLREALLGRPYHGTHVE